MIKFGLVSWTSCLRQRKMFSLGNYSSLIVRLRWVFYDVSVDFTGQSNHFSENFPFFRTVPKFSLTCSYQKEAPFFYILISFLIFVTSFAFVSYWISWSIHNSQQNEDINLHNSNRLLHNGLIFLLHLLHWLLTYTVRNSTPMRTSSQHCRSCQRKSLDV